MELGRLASVRQSQIPTMAEDDILSAESEALFYHYSSSSCYTASTDRYHAHRPQLVHGTVPCLPTQTNFTMSLKNIGTDIPARIAQRWSSTPFTMFRRCSLTETRRWKEITGATKNLKNGSPDQKSRCRTCAQACYCPLNTKIKNLRDARIVYFSLLWSWSSIIKQFFLRHSFFVENTSSL